MFYSGYEVSTFVDRGKNLTVQNEKEKRKKKKTISLSLKSLSFLSSLSNLFRDKFSGTIRMCVHALITDRVREKKKKNSNVPFFR